MVGETEIATWLISRRDEISSVMAQRLGPAAPGPAAPETEVLRRFRSFAAAALRRGDLATPALDGLRANERRVSALLAAWSDAAAEVAGERGEDVRGALDPLVVRFRTSMRSTGRSRRARGAPRAARRAVMAAIDRVADAFLAVDAETGRIVDANPAAGALLGVARDALLEVDALSFVSGSEHGSWWTQLDAMTEGAEPVRFPATLQDKNGAQIPVECSATRFTPRGRTLALILARPL